MSESCITFDVQGLGELADVLNGWSLSRMERHDLLHSLGVEIEEQTKERFHTKLAPDGSSWKAVADATKKYLRKHFPSAQPPLLREGDLMKSTESQVETEWSVLVGQTRIYAAAHQWGNDKNNIPARPSLGLNAENIADLAALAEDFTENLMARRHGDF